jgi:hypothetical protein
MNRETRETSNLTAALAMVLWAVAAILGYLFISGLWPR